MKVSNKLIYAYIKRIKRWMICPSCQHKMTYNKTRNTWICNKCDNRITEEDFLDDFMFWFCDECKTYLNNQEGFNRINHEHICTNCGYKNETTFEKAKGMCMDCGKVLINPDLFLCDECKQERIIRAKKWSTKGIKFAGITALILGTAYLASQDSNENDDEFTALPDWDSIDNDNNDYPICKTCGAKMTGFDGWAWHSCPECGNSVRIIDGTETWQEEIFGYGKKEHYSDFDLADFCSGGDLTDD